MIKNYSTAVYEKSPLVTLYKLLFSKKGQKEFFINNDRVILKHLVKIRIERSSY